MYGTIARLKVKPGMEAELLRVSETYDDFSIPGYVGTYIYRMDRDPNEYFLVILFTDREAYHTQARKPDQHQRYLQLRALLESDPEWNDGEIIWEARKS